MPFSSFKSWWAKYGIYAIIFGSIFILIVVWLINKYYSDKLNQDSPFLKRMFGYSKFNTNTNSDYQPKRKVIRESKGELICKEVAEQLFEKPFIKIRPNSLKNNVTGHNLELDIYNDDLKLAIEYNGQQHYKYTPYFHKNEEAFRNQQYRDELKRMMCKNNGITLIEVPYTVKHNLIPQYIKRRAKELGLMLGNPDL